MIIWEKFQPCKEIKIQFSPNEYNNQKLNKVTEQIKISKKSYKLNISIK